MRGKNVRSRHANMTLFNRRFLSSCFFFAAGSAALINEGKGESCADFVVSSDDQFDVSQSPTALIVNVRNFFLKKKHSLRAAILVKLNRLSPLPTLGCATNSFDLPIV